jgi:hypothetical protein
MNLRPRYFQRKSGEAPLFASWPRWKSGRWSKITPPPDDELEMTEKEYDRQEKESHLHQ